jgi:hypothetical protein
MAQLDNVPQIRQVAQALLKRASVDEELPTPVDDLIVAAGLVEATDYVLSESRIRQAPAELRRHLRGAQRKILGVLDRRERVLHVSPAIEVPAKRQFVRCHETMHDALPWQRELLVLGDTAMTLSPDIELRFEQEANQGAAELLFQVDLLARIARDYPTDISTPIELAHLFGTSIHSTIRRWIETHQGALAGLVLEPDPLSTTPLIFKRYELVESEAWRLRFGGRRFPTRLGASDHGFLAGLGPTGRGAVDLGWSLIDIDGEMASLRVQSFHNTYRTFVLLWVPGKDRFVARHRRRPRIEVA